MMWETLIIMGALTYIVAILFIRFVIAPDYIQNKQFKAAEKNGLRYGTVYDIGYLEDSQLFYVNIGGQVLYTEDLLLKQPFKHTHVLLKPNISVHYGYYVQNGRKMIRLVGGGRM